MTESINPFELTPEEEKVLDMIEEEEQYGIKKMDPEKALEMLNNRLKYLRHEIYTALNTFDECKPEDAWNVVGLIQNLTEDIQECERRISEYQLMKEGKN